MCGLHIVLVFDFSQSARETIFNIKIRDWSAHRKIGVSSEIVIFLSFLKEDQKPFSISKYVIGAHVAKLVLSSEIVLFLSFFEVHQKHFSTSKYT